MPSSPLLVEVDGRPLEGWNRLSIRRGLMQASSGFTVELADRRPWPLMPGAEVRVFWRGFDVFRGIADSLDRALGADSHVVKVGARGLVAQLVDCAPAPGAYPPLDGADVANIATVLAQPYGVEVVHEWGSVPVMAGFGLEPGETCWSAIERCARLRGLLAYEDGAGRLHLEPVVENEGRQRRTLPILREGIVLDTGALIDVSKRYRTYIVLGQQPGSDELSALAAAAVSGSAVDEEEARPRTLVAVAEGSVTPTTAKLRAEWERNVRAARATRVRVELAGWSERFAGGKVGGPWNLNTLVDVALPTLRVEGQLLLDDLELTVDGQGGTRARLELVRADAYRAAPTPGADDPFDKLLNGDGGG